MPAAIIKCAFKEIKALETSHTVPELFTAQFGKHWSTCMRRDDILFA
jgi:hypothetical protein